MCAHRAPHRHVIHGISESSRVHMARTNSDIHVRGVRTRTIASRACRFLAIFFFLPASARPPTHLRRSIASGRRACPSPASSTRRAHVGRVASGSSRGGVAFPHADFVARSAASGGRVATCTNESRTRGSFRLVGRSVVRPARQTISAARPAWQSNGRIAHVNRGQCADSHVASPHASRCATKASLPKHDVRYGVTGTIFHQTHAATRVA